MNVLGTVVVNMWLLASLAQMAPSAYMAPLLAFMEMKLLKHSLIYSCSNLKEKAAMSAYLSQHGVLSKHMSIFEDEDVLVGLIEGGARCVLVVEMYCPNLHDVLFDIASRRGQLWWGARSWVLVGRRDAAALSPLRRLPLALDADVKLLLEERVLVDVHSVDATKGTPLTLTLYAVLSSSVAEPRSIDVSQTLNMSQTEAVSIWNHLLGIDGALEPPKVAFAGWLELDKRSRVQRRWNMENKVELKAAFCINNRPRGCSAEKYLRGKWDPHRDTFTRHAVAIFEHVEHMLRFRWSGVRVRDWGELVNGSWSGVIGVLVKGEADIGMSPMLIKHERIGAVDDVGYACEATLSTLFRQPERQVASLQQYTRPLAAGVWLAALILAVLAALLGLIFDYYENPGSGSEGFLLEAANLFYLNGECGRRRRLWGSRALGAAAAALGFALQQFYGGALLGSLLATPAKSITDLRSLLRTDMQYKAEDILYHRLFFQNQSNKDPLVERVYRERVLRGPLPAFLPVDEGLRRVRLGNFAFQTTSSYGRRVASGWSPAERCSLDELSVHPRGALHHRVRRRSPFTQHLRTALLQISTSGIWVYDTALWFPRRITCPTAGVEFVPVGEQLHPAFELLAAFGGVAFAMMLMEIAIHRFTNKKLNIS